MDYLYLMSKTICLFCLFWILISFYGLFAESGAPCKQKKNWQILLCLLLTLFVLRPNEVMRGAYLWSTPCFLLVLGCDIIRLCLKIRHKTSFIWFKHFRPTLLLGTLSLLVILDPIFYLLNISLFYLFNDQLIFMGILLVLLWIASQILYSLKISVFWTCSMLYLALLMLLQIALGLVVMLVAYYGYKSGIDGNITVELMYHSDILAHDELGLISLVCMLFIYRKVKPLTDLNLHLDGKWWLLLAFVGSLITLVIHLLIIFIQTESFLPQGSYGPPLLFLMTLTMLLLLLFFTLIKFIALWQKQQDYQVMILKNEYTEMNFLQIQQIYDQNAKLSHDLNNHLQSVRYLLDHDNQGEASTYLNQLEDTLASASQIIHTNHRTADAILTNKYYEAQQKQIEMVVDAHFPSDTGIQSVDICTILANLLDNAIEACLRIDDQQRLIRVMITSKHDFLIIKIANSAPPDTLANNAELSTTKENKKQHGLGLSSVKTALTKYQGDISFDCKNGLFTALATLCFTEHKLNPPL